MKIAICFFGQPRLLNNPYGWLSQKYHLMDKYNPDIFIHSWINEKEKEFNYADQVKKEVRFKEDSNAKNIILSRYKPKRYIFEPARDFFLDENIRNQIKNKCNYSLNNESNHLSQVYSMSKSISLLENEEYDFIILTRFDVYITDFPNLYKLNKDKLYVDSHFNWFSDLLIFGGQEKIKSLNFYDRVSELCQNLEKWYMVDLKNLAYQSVNEEKEERIPIGVAVLRSNYSTEFLRY